MTSLNSHGLRFAFGTLTALPVRVTRWDRDAARAGMLCAPLAGVVVGLLAAGLGSVALLLGSGPLLAAVASAAVPAVLTRGLHLDGLADTADGLGSAKPAGDALRIMKQSDVGPFGVVTLVLVLLTQVAAGYGLYGRGWTEGAAGTVVAAVAARLALTSASRRGVPAARPEGLGAVVAGTVPVRGAVLVAVAALVACAAAGAGGTEGPGWAGGAAHAALAALLALGAAEVLLRHCVRRFGGVTGDVFGAVEETAATAALVVLAVG
ncbi:adenosylcobinamide-GDP ribazoletransferase [Streptomyces sp. NBC_01218]|uniref:adenosylcobinamide-GDP ribazoletransferase n=1 Tax=unclassified Streptomyces TaxID=2593676 RepID=UPI0023B9471D|nr:MULTISPECIES: adenosylcobinamide-GDP ribazoletransferase [unclassified Streptomyces]WEH42199.1 adenosylcobinamide-GDP ribazoletransferase [Streptomyces sp. AM 2-1-1]WSQ53821.1 adenosylcobinamide-GDP ribazoletransferase [Streptomyces sp. NBC_01218]